MGERKTKVLLVDDHEVVRYGIAQLINKQPDLMVSGEAADAGAAFDAIINQQPDLAIIDLSLKDSSGLELIKNIRARCPALPVLVISMHEESIYAEMALRAGAGGYIMKQEALDNMLAAIRRVLAGGRYISDKVADQMLNHRLGNTTDVISTPLERLSNRELEVLHLIGQWKRTHQIAKELHLSVKTVEYYREQIKAKLVLRDAAELVQYAVQWTQGNAGTSL